MGLYSTVLLHKRVRSGSDKGRMMSHHVRRGFTLVEVLVVIAVIGTLIGFLLPAVQQAPGGGQASPMQNNLRQIGLALLNYQSVNQVLPPSFCIRQGTTLGHEQWLLV